VAEVFAFATNPQNTPRWAGAIVYEETSEWPAKKGTIYRNRNKEGKWSEYEVTEYEENKTFSIRAAGGNYHVRYGFAPTANNGCDLEYYEWVDDGELTEPFTMEIMEKLKAIIETGMDGI
jgi:hypothetical protein